jgi:hypothetical protein
MVRDSNKEFLNLTTESDSSKLIDALKKSQHQGSYFGSIVEDCKSFFSLSNFNYLELVHVRREANQTAHDLAQFAISSLTDFVWIK